MKEQPVYLVLAVFDGMDNAGAALAQLKVRDRAIPSAVIMQKDAEEQVQFKDVGLTPRKGAVSGIVLGGVVGVLTGGASLALSALGGLVGSRSAKKKQAAHLLPEQLSQVASPPRPRFLRHRRCQQTSSKPKSCCRIGRHGGRAISGGHPARNARASG